MFGYVLPPVTALSPADRVRFGQVYCGLCHTLGERYGALSRGILNYDFTVLAILLSPRETQPCAARRCVAHPVQKHSYQLPNRALELAADESVILAYWQIQDGVADHGFWRGLADRTGALALQRAYQKAAEVRPDFDGTVQEQLGRLSELEHARCASMDQAADTFAEILAAAAMDVPEETHQRILRQILYHLGRWVYLIDAADDLKKDIRTGNYNPLVLRYGLQGDVLDPDSRAAFVQTLDHSIHRIAAAYELWDFGCWSGILESIFYTGLFQVGKAVLDGKFHERSSQNRNQRLLRKLHE